MDRRVDAAVAAAAESLWRGRCPDGAFTGDPPPGSVLATAGAIVALHEADPVRSGGLVAAGAGWLRRHRGGDGGWGEPAATAVAIAALRRTGSTVDVAGGLRRLLAMGGAGAVADPANAHLCRQFLDLAGLSDGVRPHRLPLAAVLRDPVRRLGYRAPAFVATALLQGVTLPAPGPLRRAGLRRAERAGLALLDTTHEAEGRTGGFGDDPWHAAIVCLGLARSGRAPHIVAAAVEYLRDRVRPDGGWAARTGADLTGTAVALGGLLAAGHAGDPRIAGTVAVLRRGRRHTPFAPLGMPAGGWSRSGERGWPGTAATAEIVAALAAAPGHADDPVLPGGADWLARRRERTGGWSPWARGTRVAGEGPCAGVTARAVTALLAAGRPEPAGVRWLLGAQRPDGTFADLGHRGRTIGTARVLEALAAAGHGGHPVAVRARDRLRETQCANGAWAGGTGGTGADGTVDETAWAVAALLRAGVPARSNAVRWGIGWLVAAQRPDGGWPCGAVTVHIGHPTPQPAGVATNGLALHALARYRAAVPLPAPDRAEA